MTAVANTSKKPSTHRCTTHQRQYSTIDDVRVLAPHQAGAVEQADRDGGQEQQADDRRGFVLAPHRRPQRAADQRQPQQQADEQEDLPEAAEVDVFPALVAEPEVVLSRPSFCITANHWPANAPTTMISRQTNSKFTPSRWNFGSCPEIAGAMYRPVPSHAVAIHSTASWVCQVRVSEYGRMLASAKP